MPRLLALIFLGLTPVATGADCTYRFNPERFLNATNRSLSATYQRTLQAAKWLPSPRLAAAGAEVAASDLAPRSFIDEEIFRTLAANNVAAARVATDGEFLRRISLDLTGRLPTPAEIRAFLADDSPTKRDAAIDRLLASPAFVDRWTIWFGDLLENASYPALFLIQL